MSATSNCFSQLLCLMSLLTFKQMAFSFLRTCSRFCLLQTSLFRLPLKPNRDSLLFFTVAIKTARLESPLLEARSFHRSRPKKPSLIQIHLVSRSTKMKTARCWLQFYRTEWKFTVVNYQLAFSSPFRFTRWFQQCKSARKFTSISLLSILFIQARLWSSQCLQV